MCLLNELLFDKFSSLELVRKRVESVVPVLHHAWLDQGNSHLLWNDHFCIPEMTHEHGHKEEAKSFTLGN